MDSGGHDMNGLAFFHRFIGISVALVIALASGLASSAEETKQPLPPPPLAYTKADQPSWLPRVLNLLVKKKGWILKDHRLFRQGGKPTFLALIWNTRRISGHGHMELYKVRVISQRNVRLNFVRGYTETSLSIEEPSGHDIGGDGVPFLALRYASHGSSYHGYGVRVYRLVRNSVDVTPDWAGLAKRMLALDGGKSLALIVADTRWGGYFIGCGQCGPYFDMVMRWTAKGFRPECKDHPDHYEQNIESYKRWSKSSSSDWPTPMRHFLWLGVAIAFNKLQMGRLNEGKALYQETLQKARERGARGWDQSEKEFNHWLNAVEKDFGPAVSAAIARPDLSCPLMAYRGEGAHPGTVERIEHFRFKPESRP